MVKRRARTLVDLGRIEGIGKARVEKHGARLISILEELSPAGEVSIPE
jgi:hypothetical protein